MTARILPIINVAPLFVGGERAAQTAREIGAACRDLGFFYVTASAPRRCTRSIPPAALSSRCPKPRK
jgi:isopenicillin N synthase-like dioxygenase